MSDPRPSETPPRLWVPLLVLAGLAVAANYLFGSPVTVWLRAVEGVYRPLLDIPVLLLLAAVVPIVALVYLGTRKK
jgi:thiosulfate reductase cytochrome b subunit